MYQLAKALGGKIREQRKARGFSQDALALACKVDRSYMGRIERGEVNITVEKLYRIAWTLECDPKCLLPDQVSSDD
ncbi:transcriptional regulator, Cro/CI family [Stutzerimonas stutzeri A1501]|uniref:Transcriptional regulator, Cro/CI family n=1 Tax=Stutzerimonas stutzeri (strain A1501) TaxID=379731 RepID=A4VHA7_STUS1|nr:helix-turn-helix transcriptional regulator [Stutzerimonas stutzeri]ABP78358.1 transcriptional regulator, Cro/CI family [Stutzerimonas stutzeri A1501]UWG61225.1 helix-turn-helix domain-containing protein [Stutzerimonas stutzeri]